MYNKHRLDTLPFKQEGAYSLFDLSGETHNYFYGKWWTFLCLLFPYPGK